MEIQRFSNRPNNQLSELHARTRPADGMIVSAQRNGPCRHRASRGACILLSLPADPADEHRLRTVQSKSAFDIRPPPASTLVAVQMHHVGRIVAESERAGHGSSYKRP